MDFVLEVDDQKWDCLVIQKLSSLFPENCLYRFPEQLNQPIFQPVKDKNSVLQHPC